MLLTASACVERGAARVGCRGSMSNEDFYVRYYVGHKGKFGHEFLEFEFRPDGKARRSPRLLELLRIQAWLWRGAERTVRMGCETLAWAVSRAPLSPARRRRCATRTTRTTRTTR